MGTEMRPLLATLLQTRASCSEGGCWLAAAGTGVTQINDGALMPNKPNDISSLNNECCHAPHTAQCWILDRLEVWVLETRCQAAGAGAGAGVLVSRVR